MTTDFIGFKTDQSLQFLLEGTLEHASLLEDTHGKCAQITLWYSDGHGVAIYSDIHDVAEKLEVGILNLRRVYEEAKSSSIALPRRSTPRTIPFSASAKPCQVWKLKITEAGIVCESGLRIALADASELMILPAAFPCYLSVFVDNHLVTTGAPEYKVEAYQQELIS